MPRTRSASARAAGGREGRQQQEDQQEQTAKQPPPKRQETKQLVAPPTPSGELGATSSPTINSKGSSSSSKVSNSSGSSGNIITSNDNNSSNVVVARAATTPASTRKVGRLSFGPVPKERYSMGSSGLLLLSFSSEDMSPSPPAAARRRCRSSSLGSAPRQHLQQGEPAAAVNASIISSNNNNNNGSDSSSCVIIDADGMDTKTSDNNHDGNVVADLLNSSVASFNIELAESPDDASLFLPPLGEIFSPDCKQQQHQQHQQCDLSPVPFILGGSSSGGNPDPAVFDFDVDEVDALIGELVEDHEQGHGQYLEGEQGGQREIPHKVQQEDKVQEEEGGQQQQQQHDDEQQQQLEKDQQQQGQKQDEAEEKVEEVKGKQETSSIAAAAAAAATTAAVAATTAAAAATAAAATTAAAAATATAATSATFAAPLKAVLMDGPVAEALEGAMTLTQRTEASTKDAFARACNVALQNQAELVLAWQKVVTTVHTAAVSFDADNARLVASNAAHESGQRGMAAHINGLENRVSVLIAERDRLAAKLKEPGAGSPAEARGNDNTNSNSNDNSNDSGNDKEHVIDSTSPAGQLVASPAKFASATTISDNRASAVAAAGAAPIATFATPAASPTLANDTATRQKGSTMTNVAAMDAVTTTTTMTTVPQHCEAGLLAQTASPAVSPSTVAVAVATKPPTAEPVPCTTTNDQPQPAKVSTPVASTTAAATTHSTTATTTTTVNNRASATASPALASDTATGQKGSTTTKVAAMDTVDTTTTMTMAPQQCKAGLLAQTAPPSMGPSTIAVSVATEAPTAEAVPRTTTNDQPQSAKIPTPVASTTAADATPSTTATATTTVSNRASAVAAAPTAPAAAFTTPAASPTSASDTATGQLASTMTNVSAMEEVTTTTTTMTVAPQECEAGLLAQTAPPSVSPSAVAAALGTTASTTQPAPPTQDREKPQPAEVVAPVASTAAAAAAAANTTRNLPANATRAATATDLEPESVTEKPKRRGGKVPDFVTEGRAPWVGGGVGGAVFPSPSAVGGNRVQAMSPLAYSSAERRSSVAARRASAAARSPLSAVSTNTTRRAVPSATGKVRKAAVPPAAKPGRASLTRATESSKAAARPPVRVSVKRIVSDDRGAADGVRPKPEGMYSRLRSSTRPRKTDTKVVAGGGQKVVSGAGVSSLSRQEAATNRGAAAGRRAKVVPKKRWV